MKNFYVYILASQARGTLYIGITNNSQRCHFEHNSGASQKTFTQKYAVKRLVYFESCNSADQAIVRVKQLKNWHRQWKINLIESVNPYWNDLGVRYGMDAETSPA